MDFRFNFPTEEKFIGKKNDDNEPVEKKQKVESVAQFREIKVEDCKTVYPCDLEVSTFQLSDEVTVCCYDDGAVEEILKKDKDESSTVVKATSYHSDLVPNVYEGGLTVWECSLDLASHVAKNVDFKDKTVLELGCGAGIPGICAMNLGATEVHFQDYNSEVLEEYTIPNVTQLNMEDDIKCRCRFFSGDWSEFSKHWDQKQRYDVILTAETIYNPDNYYKLHDIFTSRLAKGGAVYLAAKSNYFGVGGGTMLFGEFVEEMDKFDKEICENIEAGVPREVWKVTWKQKKITDNKNDKT